MCSGLCVPGGHAYVHELMVVIGVVQREDSVVLCILSELVAHFVCVILRKPQLLSNAEISIWNAVQQT